MLDRDAGEKTPDKPISPHKPENHLPRQNDRPAEVHTPPDDIPAQEPSTPPLPLPSEKDPVNYLAKPGLASSSIPELDKQQAGKMQAYYAFQSRIYDATRWSFLFGRQAIIKQLPFERKDSFTILEVGCGTGYNLLRLLRRYPHAQVVGVDLSSDMLERARRKTRTYSNRLQLLQGAYGQLGLPVQPDVVLFSYCLTMVNPYWPALIRQAKTDLKPGGYLALVDFHDSRFGWFRRHMAGHHVRMEGHLLPFLQQSFDSKQATIHGAYGGLWEYVSYLGQK